MGGTGDGLPTLRGRYRLRELLGAGARGAVYRADDLLLGRPVAVKVLRGAATDPAALAEHEAEARRLAALTMHGLVTLFDLEVDAAEQPPVVFLVLELVDGTDLKRVVERGPLTPRQTAFVGLDLAEALEWIHARGFVHGDVTPANVLLLEHGVDRRPRVKLGDFGVHDLVGGAGAAGLYRSPEQAAGEPAGPAADVYALGLVLLECLAGREGRAEAVPAGEWRTVLAEMLDPRPEARPTAAALAALFRRMVVAETGRHRDAPEVDPEAARLAALRAYGVLDTPPDTAFDRIAELVRRTLGTAVAAIGLVDADRVWFKARAGALPAEVPRAGPLAAALEAEPAPAGIEDASADPVLAADPLVRDGVRFAASAPIVTPDGRRIGLLVAFDPAPHLLTDAEAATLADLAAIVLHELELRQAARRAALARR